MVFDVIRLQYVIISQLFVFGDLFELGLEYWVEDGYEEVMEMEVSILGEVVEVVEEVMEIESFEKVGKEIFEFGGSDVLILDIIRLLRSCVQSVVGMFRDQNESCMCNMWRVVFFLGFLNEDDVCYVFFLWVFKMCFSVFLKK